MKKIWLLLFTVMLLFGSLTSCTKAEREANSRKKAAENGQLLRTVQVWNARSKVLIWEGEGYINLTNSSNGDYEFLIWDAQGNSSRELINGRDNYCHVHDMTIEEMRLFNIGKSILHPDKTE